MLASEKRLTRGGVRLAVTVIHRLQQYKTGSDGGDIANELRVFEMENRDLRYEVLPRSRTT